jgi:hypothetical protein
MKPLLLSLIILITNLSAHAQQKKVNIIAGLNIGYPLQTINTLRGKILSAGLDLNAHFNVSSQVSITSDIGYTAVFATDDAGPEIIPVRGGICYYPSEKFFIGGKIGVGFVKNGGFITTNGGYASTLAYAFNTGFKISQHIELGASYEAYTKGQSDQSGFQENNTISIINLKLGYWF